MSIEVNEMIVKTTLDKDKTTRNELSSDSIRVELNRFRTQVLSECRAMFLELLEEREER